MSTTNRRSIPPVRKRAVLAVAGALSLTLTTLGVANAAPVDAPAPSPSLSATQVMVESAAVSGGVDLFDHVVAGVSPLVDQVAADAAEQVSAAATVAVVDVAPRPVSVLSKVKADKDKKKAGKKSKPGKSKAKGKGKDRKPSKAKGKGGKHPHKGKPSKGKKPPKGKSNPPAPSFGEQVMRIAASKAGTPYVYGATGPNAFDCSGFTQWVYAHAGRNLPRTSDMQAGAVNRISAGQAQRGDLVFFHNGGDVYHVGLYAGDHSIWHSPRTGSSVRKERIWSSSVFYGRL